MHSQLTIPRGAPIERTCEGCRVVFLIPRHQVRSGQGRFCTSACYRAAQPALLANRFWAKVQKGDGCWLWVGAKRTHGYGQINLPNRGGTIAAHRLAYILTFGPIAKELDICHRCDNPPCVRPDHLFVGTHVENMRDAKEKGRMGPINPAPPFGMANGQAKLTDDLVREIRGLYATGQHGQRELARRYSLSQKTMRLMLLRQTWKHVA